MLDVETAAAFEAIVEFANKECGGHFVIMKFTTNWRVSFSGQYCFSRGDGTNETDEIKQLPVGNTLKEAYIAALMQWQQS